MMERFSAELQGHEREHVLELPSEYFLPEYELEIEDYFRRLSEDQPDRGDHDAIWSADFITASRWSR